VSKKVFVFNKGRWVLDPMEVNKARREVWIRARLAYLDKLIKQFGWKRI
jgi:hypothetical protein